VKQHKEHRKKQKGLADSEEPVEEEVPLEADPGTTLATQSTSAGPFLGRVVSAENAKLYLSLVNTALREPLPALDFADPAGLPLKDHQEMVHRCKQKVPVPLFFFVFFFFFFNVVLVPVFPVGLRGAGA
jgi:hypothetical protein